MRLVDQFDPEISSIPTLKEYVIDVHNGIGAEGVLGVDIMTNAPEVVVGVGGSRGRV